MSLEKEIETYQKHLPELLKDEGKYVLIHETDIVGTYETREAALVLGYERFKLSPFLIKRITRIEQPLCITRRTSPATCQ